MLSVVILSSYEFFNDVCISLLSSSELALFLFCPPSAKLSENFLTSSLKEGS